MCAADGHHAVARGLRASQGPGEAIQRRHGGALPTRPGEAWYEYSSNALFRRDSSRNAMSGRAAPHTITRQVGTRSAK
jgi:hypothetical protein